MRVVGIGAWMLVLLVGCSRDNPLFVLNTAGAAEATTEVSTPGSGTQTGETADTQSTTGTTSSDPSDTDLPGTASTLASSDTTASTASSDTTTASTSASTSISSSSSSSDSTGDGTGTSGESASTTGGPDPEEVVLYDLVMLCPFMNTYWLAGEGMGPPLLCMTSDTAPWVGPEDYVHDGKVVKSLGLFPVAQANAAITGEYHKLNLQKSNSPRLRALLVYPPGGDDGKITGHLRVEFGIGKVVPGSAVEIQLLSGQVHAFDVDLDLAEIKESAEVTLVMVLQVDVPATDIGGVWLAPRIVETAP